MKPKGLAKTLLETSALTAAIVVNFAAPPAAAASDTWDNGGGDNLWQTGTNWVTDAFPGTAGAVFTSTDDATFSTTGAGGTIDLGGTINIRSLIFGVSGGDAASFAIGDANDTLNFTTGGGITINSGVTTAQTIGASGTTINLSTAASAATTFTNNGTGLLTIAGNIVALDASGTAGVLTVGGTGNTTVTGTITEPGAGNNALFKTGSGTLTLSNGSAWSGAGAVQTAFSGPFTVQEGTLLLNGGTHAVTGEAVIGGVVTHGGAGQNAKIQVDAGALNISSYLSVGRGNGIGGVSSDLVLNNAATVTAANYSGGFSAGNALNMPKGTITLNNSSALTISGNGVFNHAESTGSNLSMTMNGSSSFTAAGTGNKWIGNAGTGTLTMNNTSTANFGTGTLFIGGIGGNGTLTLNGTSSFTYGNATTYVGYRTGTGTLNVAGGTFTSGGELRVSGTDANGAFTGSSGTVNISSGTATVGSLTIARGNDNTFAGTGTLNLSGGSFTSTGATTVGSRSGTAAINMTGGTFTTGSLSIASSNAAADKAVGTVTVGSGSTLTSINDAIVGLGGTGASGASGKLILNGGTVNVGTTAEKWLKVGAFDTVAGQIDINSGTLNLNTGTDIRFNTNGGTGTSVINQNGGNVVSYSDNGVTLGGATVLDFNQAGSTGNNTYNLNGGTLAISQVTSSVNNGTRTFNFNGGTLKVASSANAATFFNLGTGGTTRANVRNGGAIIDTNGIDVTFAQALLHSNVGGDNATDGGLTKNGLGKLTLSGASTFTGATTINAGTLALGASASLASAQITAASGATFDVSAQAYTVGSGVTLTNNGTVNGGFAVASGGTLNGSGTFNGLVTVNGGALNPGNSPGSQTYTAGLTLATASTTTMEIAGLGGIGGTDFDYINVTGGTLTFDATLAIVDFGGHDISGQTAAYNLFDFVTATGDFDTVTVDGNALTYNVGTDDWSATVGNTTYNFAEGNGVLSVSVVPEPTAALLGGLGLLGLLRRRRQG